MSHRPSHSTPKYGSQEELEEVFASQPALDKDNVKLSDSFEEDEDFELETTNSQNVRQNVRDKVKDAIQNEDDDDDSLDRDATISAISQHLDQETSVSDASPVSIDPFLEAEKNIAERIAREPVRIEEMREEPFSFVEKENVHKPAHHLKPVNRQKFSALSASFTSQQDTAPQRLSGAILGGGIGALSSLALVTAFLKGSAATVETTFFGAFSSSTATSTFLSGLSTFFGSPIVIVGAAIGCAYLGYKYIPRLYRRFFKR